MIPDDNVTAEELYTILPFIFVIFFIGCIINFFSGFRKEKKSLKYVECKSLKHNFWGNEKWEK